MAINDRPLVTENSNNRIYANGNKIWKEMMIAIVYNMTIKSHLLGAAERTDGFKIIIK